MQAGLQAGIKKGYEGFIWMMKIVIPISLLTAILDWSGLLGHLDFFLKPLMGTLYLPPEAALPLAIGILSSVYAAIAAMIVFPFSAGITKPLRTAILSRKTGGTWERMSEIMSIGSFVLMPRSALLIWNLSSRDTGSKTIPTLPFTVEEKKGTGTSFSALNL